METKMHFQLRPDADGWPPVAVESVWVTALDDGCFAVGNIPVFAVEATLDDIVEAEWNGAELRYKATVRASGNSLLRVIYAKGSDPAGVRGGLTALGCSTELDDRHGIVAVNVPPHVDLVSVQDFLARGAREDKWDYEEALLRQ
jgi:hypothetical protein